MSNVWVKSSMGGGGISGRDPLDRFREKYVVDSATGCFVWQGAINSRGYGSFGYGGKSVLAHRWAWEHVRGERIPDGLQIDHFCARRRCVNTAHMRVVTCRENTLAEHSDSPAGVNARRTHCIRGHLLEGANLIRKKDGHRECRECRRAYDRAAYHRAKAAGTDAEADE